jgi:hypothetical protein
MTLAEWIKRRLKEMCQGWPVWQPLTKISVTALA